MLNCLPQKLSFKYIFPTILRKMKIFTKIQLIFESMAPQLHLLTLQIMLESSEVYMVIFHIFSIEFHHIIMLYTLYSQLDWQGVIEEILLLLSELKDFTGFQFFYQGQPLLS